MIGSQMNDRKRTLQSRRNGMAIVLVLGVIAMTLAMSYAMMRSQFTMTRVQENATRHGDARNAAVAGITHAIRVMHDSDEWAGVDSTIQGNLNPALRYEVTYTAGDPSLDPSNMAAYPGRDYDKYAYRVTLDAIGYAVDPDDADRETSHHIRTVMQLVPRKLSTAEPTKWSAINQYTVYQWHADKAVSVELPVHVEGAAYLQGALNLAESYPFDSKPFDGIIDEVAIFNYALTAEQLLGIYDSATDVANLAADKLGAALSPLSPTHWWRMGEATGATTISDSVGGNDGTWVGVHESATGAPGAGTPGAEFRGRHDAVNLGALDIDSSTMTICGWFKADSFDRHSDARIISKAYSSAEYDHYWMLSTISDGGHMRLRFRLKTASSTTTLIGTGGSFSPGEWIFAAAVYDGTMMRLYQNGVEVGSVAKSGAIDTSNSVDVFIGDNPPGSSRARYLVDLERMRVAGLGDHRPFTGPLALGANNTDQHTLSLLTDELSTTVDATIENNTSNPLDHPGDVVTYQLYTGGPVYSVPRIASTLSGETIAPDPVNNPLGVYRDNGQDTSIYANTSFQGVLISDGGTNDIRVKGGNVALSSVKLLAMDDGTVYQLPIVLVKGDLVYESSGGGTVEGMPISWQHICLEPGPNQTLDVTGRVVAKELRMKGPSHWSLLGYSYWNTIAYYFTTWENSQTAPQYFPKLVLEWSGYDYRDRLTVKPDAAAPNYHWHDWQNPIIVPHLDDPGLRWDLVEWTDNPVTN